MHNSSEAPTQLFVIFLLLYLFIKLSSWELHENFQLLFNIFVSLLLLLCRRNLVYVNPEHSKTMQVKQVLKYSPLTYRPFLIIVGF